MQLPSRLLTSHLALTRIKEADVGQLAAMYAADLLAGYPNSGPNVIPPMLAALEFVKTAVEESTVDDEPTFTWVMRKVGDQNQIIGTVEATAIDPSRIELAWRVGVNHNGRGYAKEAGGALAYLGLTDSAIAGVVARVSPDNTASIKVAEGLGMRRIEELDTPTDLKSLVEGLSDDSHVILGINSPENVPKHLRQVWFERGGGKEPADRF